VGDTRGNPFAHSGLQGNKFMNDNFPKSIRDLFHDITKPAAYFHMVLLVIEMKEKDGSAEFFEPKMIELEKLVQKQETLLNEFLGKMGSDEKNNKGLLVPFLGQFEWIQSRVRRIDNLLQNPEFFNETMIRVKEMIDQNKKIAENFGD